MIHNFGRLARHRNAIALSLAALLAGASASAAQTTSNWLHLEANPERLATWEEIAAAYEAENPDVNIEFQFVENEAFKAKLKAERAGDRRLGARESAAAGDDERHTRRGQGQGRPAAQGRPRRRPVHCRFGTGRGMGLCHDEALRDRLSPDRPGDRTAG